MRLGIDFGTTRTVVAAVDRGNYPIVTFDGSGGEAHDWYPPLVALRDGRRRYGWEAWARQAEPGWTIVRSLKRTLENAGPGTHVQIDETTLPLFTLVAEMAGQLARDLRERSGLQLAAGEPLEVMLGVPANANSNQRFLTAEAFRQAGFHVLGLLNEPSAASIEFGHRQRLGQSHDAAVLVYDLGGGTFDASLVEMSRRTHTVLASEGIPTLGGDDFDHALAELALDAAGLNTATRDSLTQAELFRLHEECRSKKEALHPNSRRLTIDLEAAREGLGTVAVPAADYYERCRPMVEETVHAMGNLLARHGFAPDGAARGDTDTRQRLEAVYVTGGGSELPLVGRVLRETFGRRVKRSAHSRAATAIGLAVQADHQASYTLREQFTRFFGVWREADEGRRMIFDPLFAKGTSLPAPGEPAIVEQRAYSPAHNVGHFRYLECSRQTDDGQPQGDILLWDEIQFPYDATLREQPELAAVSVDRSVPVGAVQVEERYACDASGTVTVTITNASAGYSREYRLGRWAGKDAPVTPVKSRRRK